MSRIKLGDKNTYFFHMQCLYRRRKNSILRLSDGNRSFYDIPSIKRVIIDHFKGRFCQDRTFIGIIPDSSLKSLSVDEISTLEQPFSLQEIKAVVWQCDSTKP